MRLSAWLLTLPLALADKLDIPEVRAAIANQLDEFKAYPAYTAGPTGSAKAVAALPTPQALVQVLGQQAQAAAVAAAPYWYETINHQGIAAFNGNSGYKVFRNVKSYGAKGYVSPPFFTNPRLITLQ